MKITLPVIITASLILAGCIPAPAPTPPADNTAPTLAQVTPVPTATNDTTPSYTFSSNEAGTIIYGGSCSSVTTTAIKGNTTITFSTLAVGTYSDCTIKVKDAAKNTSALLAVNSFTISTVIPRPLNDTGITACGDYASGYSGNYNNDVNCATAGSTQTMAGTDGEGDPVPAGQDAVYGRDTNPATNSDADGHKGFSFTKLKSDGTALAIQNGTWSDAGSETAGTKWSCVQDNVTGLIWEIKTNDGGLRDKDWYYTWYNSTGINDGGEHGIGDTGVGTTTGFETHVGTYAGSDNCYNTSRCDTEKYVTDVNSAALCGASNWRLPSAHELRSIVASDRINPSIDAAFFPNTAGTNTEGAAIEFSYWSSSPTGNTAARYYAWFVFFYHGESTITTHNAVANVRLVRGGI